MGGNGEFSTQKGIWVEMGNFLPKKSDIDGYGSGRTRWSEVGLKILLVKGSISDAGSLVSLPSAVLELDRGRMTLPSQWKVAGYPSQCRVKGIIKVFFQNVGVIQ